MDNSIPVSLEVAQQQLDDAQTHDEVTTAIAECSAALGRKWFNSEFFDQGEE